MSQFPPNMPPGPGAYSMPPAPHTTSKAAITSLVLGILGCVPFATGIAAAIFGIVGISATRNPQVRGRGMAIAGLILGIVSLAGWGIMTTLFSTMFAGSPVQRQTAHDWLYDLSTSNVVAAQSLTSASFPAQDMANLQTTLPSYGALKTLTAVAINTPSNNGQSICTIGGAATFSGQTTNHSVTMTLANESGTWKVTQCKISP